MAINRCQMCKIGTSFCVYTQTVQVENQFGKKYYDVPAQTGEINEDTLKREGVYSNNCIIGNEDEYALWPDTEAIDRGIGDSAFLELRECEATDETGMDPFIANKYLWESLTTNITMGDSYDIEGRRFDSIHPLFHMIDYNVPMNKTGLLKPFENCFIMGQGTNLTLVSKNWEIDDFGEAKKAIGIPKVRTCVGLYGTRDPMSGVTMHKSMKDWTRHIPAFKNYTTLKVSKYTDATLNIFTNDMGDIDRYVSTIITDIKIKARLYDAYSLIKHGKYINVYALLLNNGMIQSEIFKITNTISTKDPKSVYQNKEGYRYNISKIAALYFNIVDDTIKIRFNKKEILGNIVNYILNDLTLLNHKVTKPKLDIYTQWYDSVKSELDDELLDDIRPERMMINHYNSDDKLTDAISVLADAIYNQKIVDKSELPKELSQMVKYNRQYKDNYVEKRDIFEIGAAGLQVEKLITINYPDAYKQFTNIVRHLEMITPNGFKDLWERYQDAFSINEPVIFWDYVQELADEYDQVGYKLNELFISEDTLDISAFDHAHSNYIRAKNKRWYSIENQDAEHFKMFSDDEDLDDTDESMWN